MFRIQIRSNQVFATFGCFSFQNFWTCKKIRATTKKETKKPTRNLKERCPSSATKLRVWLDQDIQSTLMLRLQGNLRSVRPSVCLFIRLSVRFPHLSIFPSVCSSVCLPIPLPIFLCVCLFVVLFACPTVCLSPFQFVSVFSISLIY
jgi:hypothetical protein